MTNFTLRNAMAFARLSLMSMVSTQIFCAGFFLFLGYSRYYSTGGFLAVTIFLYVSTLFGLLVWRTNYRGNFPTAASFAGCFAAGSPLFLLGVSLFVPAVNSTVCY